MWAAPETVGRLLYCRHLAAGEIGLMKYRDLRDFIQQLEKLGELKRVTREVDPRLEMTEICDRTLKAGGPAILFENPKGSSIPVLGNLFGTERRVALGMGRESVEELRELGELLAFLKEPEPPKGFRDAWEKLPIFRKVLSMNPKVGGSGPCQEHVIEGDDVDLTQLPIQTCWPCVGWATGAARWISRNGSRPTPGSRSRWRWRWAPTRPPSWAR